MAPAKPRAFPLRAHLLVLVVGTLLPALALTAVLLQRVIQDNRDAVQRRLLETARAQAAVVDAELTGTVRALQALAESDLLSQGDLAAFHDEAARVQGTQPAWYTVALHDANGMPMVSTLVAYGASLPGVGDPDSLQTVLKSPKPVVGNLRRGERGMLAFPVRVPVMRDGELRYVLSAVITPDRLTATLPPDAALEDEWVRGIVDARGTLVARSRDAARYVGLPGTDAARQRFEARKEGVFRDSALDGQTVYGAFAHAPFSGWIAGVAVPAPVIDASLWKSMSVLAGVGVLLLGLGSWAAFLSSRRIAHDIAGATVAAEAIARGETPVPSRSTVSEVTQLSDALERSAALLEARQRERDEHLLHAEAARAEAEAADRAKDAFLAMLGHELRNPLAPVLTALELMRLRGDGSLQRERAIIERQVRHLVRLVDDLLDVSRVRRGRVELRRRAFEIINAIDKAVEIANPFIAERGHRLSVDVSAGGLIVDGDETRLAQVFANLLTNAAKYADHPGHIQLEATGDAETVSVTCHDEGVGMGPELLPRVFDLFAQGHQTLDRREGGLGLGLALAKTLVEMHGGTIRADSPGLGHGSTFTVRLPRARVSAPADQTPRPDTNFTGRGRRVLVVDDNQDAAQMMAEALRLAGCDVAVEFDGATALKRMTTFLADIVILDIGLPSMNGFELARRLRATVDGRRLRILAVTGYSQASDMLESHAAGIDRHLVKPVTTEVLFAALQSTEASDSTPEMPAPR